jgi:DNA polymerase-1
MIDSSKAVYLIDASAFVFRAYHALAPLSSKGRPSHAVAGFASMLLKLLREKKPRACIVVFDSKRPSFRKELYSEYKANRSAPPPDISDQIVAVMEMCKLADFPILQDEGMEADDWIASFVASYRKKFPIVVVSTDKDLTQFICEDVVLLDSFKDRFIGPKEVEEKWGVRPDQMGDLLSLVGDTSDNVPGIPGVGPKTAAQWLKEYSNLDSLLAKQDSLPEKIQKKILPHLKQLELSRKLIALKQDLKIPFDEVPIYALPFPKKFRDFLSDWDCVRTLTQFAEELGSIGNQVSAESAERPAGSLSANAELKLIQSIDELKKLIQQIKTKGSFAFDTETNDFDRQKAKIVGFSFACDLTEAWYLPLRHSCSPEQNIVIPEKEALSLLKEIFLDPKITKIAHNLKYDIQMLWKDGLDVVGPVFDTMIEAHLLHADRRSFSLENLSREFLGKEKGDLKALLQESEDFSTIPLETACLYAAQDAHLAFELHQTFSQELEKRPEIKWLFEEVEMPLVEVLAKMEARGILLDVVGLQKLSKELHEKISALQKKICELAGEEFNLQSPKQLQTILFTKLGLTATKKTKTGFSTDESVLQELADVHELPRLLLEHRGLIKLTSTYVDVLPTLVSPDNRLHTHYHQTGTATGRLSSSDPNLQNIPVRTEEGRKIRAAFIPEDGFKLFSADYSQVELRLFAHMSEDEHLIKAFHNNRDIHSETAKIIFGSDDKEFRARSKAINFGIIYGISAFGLAKQLSISRSEAAQFIEAYFKEFPRLKIFMDELISRARKTQCTETLFGRRRPLPDIQSKNPTLRQMAERIAINAPVQGTAADIMKSAMVRIERRLKGMKSRLLLQVHDELLFEADPAEQASFEKLVIEEMMNLSSTPLKQLSVPLVVDCGFGNTWSEL